jgi:hypothetical protein
MCRIRQRAYGTGRSVLSLVGVGSTIYQAFTTASCRWRRQQRLQRRMIVALKDHVDRSALSACWWWSLARLRRAKASAARRRARSALSSGSWRAAAAAKH